MTFFLQLCFAGIATGCIYALIALGFTIIFKASQVVNFAQGEFLLVGAFLASVADYSWHLGFFLSVLVGMVATIAIGLLFERFALRRMIGKPIFSIIMVTIGLDILLRTGVILTPGSSLANPATPFGGATDLDVGGVKLGANELWTIFITVLLCLALYLFFRYTKYGLAMRATAIDQEAALATGIKVRTVYALAWGIAAAIATIGGVFLAIKSFTIDITLGAIALRAFPAIILGGLDSVSGAVVGGIIIGLAEELTNGYGSSFANITGQGFGDIAPYILMLLVLFIRPYGLFGSRKVERV